MTAVFCFRNDLRIHDNPGLFNAALCGEVLPIYIIDETDSSELVKLGAASKWWLYHSLLQLDISLGGGKLLVCYGNTLEIWSQLAQNYKITSAYWNKSFEKRQTHVDSQARALLNQRGIECHEYNANLLWEPEHVRKNDGDYYKVFTPFYRNGCLKSDAPRDPLGAPKNIAFTPHKEQANAFFSSVNSEKLQITLLGKFNWYAKLTSHWHPGETAAEQKLAHFLEHALAGYKTNRNHPSIYGVSRLAPHLHFGEISIHTVWHSVQAKKSTIPEQDWDCFLSELGWREFSHYLLYFFPELNSRNFQAKFDQFPWHHDEKLLAAWKNGLTGYPIVDAGMRELWQTGYMHNRVRMVVGSFLVKNLLIDWRYGEKWFWDCLLDADLANNSAGWQWVAGSGADAAPYFRVFNPILQGEKFDQSGEYTRKFIPELAQLPDKYLFKPWEAPTQVREQAGVTLGANYPWPIVSPQDSRDAALAAYKNMTPHSA